MSSWIANAFGGKGNKVAVTEPQKTETSEAEAASPSQSDLQFRETRFIEQQVAQVQKLLPVLQWRGNKRSDTSRVTQRVTRLFSAFKKQHDGDTEIIMKGRVNFYPLLRALFQQNPSGTSSFLNVHQGSHPADKLPVDFGTPFLPFGLVAELTSIFCKTTSNSNRIYPIVADILHPIVRNQFEEGDTLSLLPLTDEFQDDFRHGFGPGGVPFLDEGTPIEIPLPQPVAGTFLIPIEAETKLPSEAFSPSLVLHSTPSAQPREAESMATKGSTVIKHERSSASVNIVENDRTPPPPSAYHGNFPVPSPPAETTPPVPDVMHQVKDLAAMKTTVMRLVHQVKELDNYTGSSEETLGKLSRLVASHSSILEAQNTSSNEILQMGQTIAAMQESLAGHMQSQRDMSHEISQRQSNIETFVTEMQARNDYLEEQLRAIQELVSSLSTDVVGTKSKLSVMSSFVGPTSPPQSKPTNVIQKDDHRRESRDFHEMLGNFPPDLQTFIRDAMLQTGQDQVFSYATEDQVLTLFTLLLRDGPDLFDLCNESELSKIITELIDKNRTVFSSFPMGDIRRFKRWAAAYKVNQEVGLCSTATWYNYLHFSSPCSPSDPSRRNARDKLYDALKQETQNHLPHNRTRALDLLQQIIARADIVANDPTDTTCLRSTPSDTPDSVPYQWRAWCFDWVANIHDSAQATTVRESKSELQGWQKQMDRILTGKSTQRTPEKDKSNQKNNRQKQDLKQEQRDGSPPAGKYVKGGRSKNFCFFCHNNGYGDLYHWSYDCPNNKKPPKPPGSDTPNQPPAHRPVAAAPPPTALAPPPASATAPATQTRRVNSAHSDKSSGGVEGGHC